MTNDDFEYFRDEDFQWTGILDLYKGLSFINAKGVNFRIIMQIGGELEELDLYILKSFGQSWTWGEDRRIKAFKLLDFQYINNRLVFDFKTIRKSRNYDEIKYFLFDLGAYIKHEGYEIKVVQITELK
jgi:hypothetical protein